MQCGRGELSGLKAILCAGENAADIVAVADDHEERDGGCDNSQCEVVGRDEDRYGHGDGSEDRSCAHHAGRAEDDKENGQ